MLMDLVRVGEQVEDNSGYRPAVRNSFQFWCEHALAPRGLVPARHHEIMIEFLEDLANGEFDRGMIHMPPGYAKTEFVSILFPAWFLARFPASDIIAATNKEDLAKRNGRRVRDLVAEHHDALGYGLSSASQAADEWETTKGGAYYATGVSGSAIGRRADLCIIDDPFRSRAEVEQQANRDQVRDWYRSTIIGRMKPHGKIVLMHTRWHEDDLAGWLLDQKDAGGERWRVLSMPAIALDPDNVPKGVTYYPDPLHRAPGEPLWPAWENKEALERKKVEVGAREWSSQYQQSPVTPEGALFHTDKITIVDKLPAPIDQIVSGWDFAATEQTGGNDPDWTARVKLAGLTNGQFIVLDAKRMQGSPHDVEQMLIQTSLMDGMDVPISLPQDPAAAGKFVASYFISKLVGFQVHASLESGNKTTRAGPIIAQVEAGNLLVMAGDWVGDFLSELKSFPDGTKDDQVDALSRAFMRLLELIGSVGIIKYYEQMVRSARVWGSGEAGGRPSAPGAVPIENREAVDAYNDAFDLLAAPKFKTCARCHQALGAERVEDGVSSWHPACF